MSRYRAYICGGDMRPGPRGTDCPSELHDFPLPSGYVDEAEEAMSRLNRGWGNPRCPRCGLYGWIPGRPRKGEELPARVRPELVEEDQTFIAPGWTSAHLRRPSGVSWTLCGREIKSAVEALPHDRRCGQCQRRRAVA